MPLRIDNLITLQDYFAGVVARSEHHAQNIDEVVYALLGMIILFHNKDKKISVLPVDGETKNVLWFFKGDRRIALSYSHATGSIEMREGSTQGNVIYSLNNTTAVAALKNTFESL